MVDFASNDQLQAKLGQFILFDGHKAYGGSGDGFTDGFGIAGIVLRRLHIQVDNWWGDQPHVMAMLAKPPGSVMGTPAGFLPQASIPMRSGGTLAIKVSNVLRARRFRSTTCPLSSMPTT